MAAVDNDFADPHGEIKLFLTFAARSQSDMTYRQVISEFPVSIIDDDRLNVNLAPTELVLNEDGAAEAYHVSLGANPLGEARIVIVPEFPVQVLEPRESFLVFDSQNWAKPQKVWAKALNDNARNCAKGSDGIIQCTPVLAAIFRSLRPDLWL